MALYSGFYNADIQKVERPQNSGPGGDEILRVILFQSIPMIRAPFSSGSSASTISKADGGGDDVLWIDLHSPAVPNSIQDVQPGDYVTWRSRTKGLTTRTIVSLVVNVNIWDPASFVRSHIEFLTRRT